MKFSLLIIVLTFAASAHSQTLALRIDSVINLEIEKQKARGIREIGYTKVTCINYGIRTTAYLFWNEGNKCRIQKIEDAEDDKINVRTFPPIVFIDSVFFPFYKKNAEALTHEEVKAFQHKIGYTTKTSHSCFRYFKLFVDGAEFDKHFDFFDLQEFSDKEIDNSTLSKRRIKAVKRKGWKIDRQYKYSPDKNLNFRENNGLKIVEWDILVSKFTNRL